MIVLSAVELALTFTAAVALAATLIALGWACHMLYDAENKPTRQVVIPARYVPDDTPPIAYPGWRRDREAARTARYFRCPERLPAAPAMRLDLLADALDTVRPPQPMPGWEVKEDNRRRFTRNPEQLRKDADAIAAKKRARTERVQAQVITSTPDVAAVVTA